VGKRSSFERNERDFYRTPLTAVHPLLLYLSQADRLAEPCAGDGLLVGHLNAAGRRVVFASDIHPEAPGIEPLDVFEMKAPPKGATKFCTNPPWRRDILHPLIVHLSDMLPTWLLFDADWMHTKQARELLERCVKIVSVGRVKWIPGSKFTGKDNCAWYLFDKVCRQGSYFYGRRGG
jgi:hypothetical protein